MTDIYITVESWGERRSGVLEAGLLAERQEKCLFKILPQATLTVVTFLHLP